MMMIMIILILMAKILMIMTVAIIVVIMMTKEISVSRHVVRFTTTVEVSEYLRVASAPPSRPVVTSSLP